MLTYIYNNWRLGDSPSKSNINVKRSEVVWSQHKDKVLEEIAVLLGLPTAIEGTPGWFAKRMPAIHNVISRMSAEETAELDAQVATIAEKGYPEEERPR